MTCDSPHRPGIWLITTHEDTSVYDSLTRGISNVMASTTSAATTGLAATIKILSATENEAAVPVLLSALNATELEIQGCAVEAIMVRRSLIGQREILRRLKTIGQRWHAILEQRRGRMTQALRDALLHGEETMCANGCEAMLKFHEYDLIPTLVNAIEDEANPHADLAAATLLQLTDCLYEELHNPRDYKLRRDPQLVRRNVITSLEESVKRYTKHKRSEPIEAFLLLAGRENATLMQLLADPRQSCYVSVIQALQNSARPGVMRLILSYLDDPHAPSALISALVHRTDARFIELLLRKIGREPTSAAKANLKHMTTVAWLKPGQWQTLDELDTAGQHSALQLALACGLKNQDQFALVQHLAAFGNAGGRRAAVEALKTFNGADANRLIEKFLHDSDPLVQASALSLLRTRGMSGALATLIAHLDHGHPEVRRAAQQNLPEYTFARYASAYDALPEDIRKSSGALVLRVDRQAVANLTLELRSNSGKRRMRALSIARSMNACQAVELVICELLHDTDHMVRVEAAHALGDCDSTQAEAALTLALDDSSHAVHEAAQHSLERLHQHPVLTLDRIIDQLNEGMAS